MNKKQQEKAAAAAAAAKEAAEEAAETTDLILVRDLGELTQHERELHMSKHLPYVNERRKIEKENNLTNRSTEKLTGLKEINDRKTAISDKTKEVLEAAGKAITIRQSTNDEKFKKQREKEGIKTMPSFFGMISYKTDDEN